MSCQRAWLRYLDAMNRHLASAERMRDRLQYYVGRPPRMPLELGDAEAAAWRDLIAESEESAASHRQALEAFLRAAERHA